MRASESVRRWWVSFDGLSRNQPQGDVDGTLDSAKNGDDLRVLSNDFVTADKASDTGRENESVYPYGL